MNEISEKEIARLDKLMCYERELQLNGISLIGGIDEAGRGPLAGPVVAACVILPNNKYIAYINDSKKLTPKKRDELYDNITKEAVSVGVGIVDCNVIDEINILEATRLAMKQAVDNMQIKPEYVLVDAEKHVPINIPYKSIIKGDALSISIGAASIIAKVTRDRIMDKMDEQYPLYGFKQHKGYGTKQHIDALKEHGMTPIHRKSFCKNFVKNMEENV